MDDDDDVTDAGPTVLDNNVAAFKLCGMAEERPKLWPPLELPELLPGCVDTD